MIDYRDFETVKEINEELSEEMNILVREIINIETLPSGFFRVWYRC